MDIKTDISSFAKKEEAKAKAWFGTNWVPFGLGLVVGILLTAAAHHL